MVHCLYKHNVPTQSSPPCQNRLPHTDRRLSNNNGSYSELLSLRNPNDIYEDLYDNLDYHSRQSWWASCLKPIIYNSFHLYKYSYHTLLITLPFITHSSSLHPHVTFSLLVSKKLCSYSNNLCFQIWLLNWIIFTGNLFCISTSYYVPVQKAQRSWEGGQSGGWTK